MSVDILFALPSPIKTLAAEWRSVEERCGTFPTCQLHKRPIVDGLPNLCPFRADNPIDALVGIQDSAWAATAKWEDVDRTLEGKALQERYRVCFDCYRQIGGHPVIQQLRTARTRP